MTKVKYLIFCITLLLIFSILTSCTSSSSSNEAIKYLDASKEQSRVYLMEKNTDYYYTNESYIPQLSVYLVDSTYNMTIKFSQTPSYKDIDRSLMFFFKYAILEYNQLSGLPYKDGLDVSDLDYNKAMLRIFVDNDLVLYQSHNMETKEVEYYENINMDLPTRYYEDEFTKTINTAITDLLGHGTDLKVLKPFKANVILFNVNSKKKLDSDDIDSIKSIIVSTKNSPQFTNNRYGITVNLFNSNSKHIEYSYINQEWTTTNWMHLNFIN